MVAQSVFYLLAYDRNGDEWRVFPDVDPETLTWSYTVTEHYVRVAHTTVRPGDKLTGSLVAA